MKNAVQPMLRLANDAESSSVADVLITSHQKFLPFAPHSHTEIEIKDWVKNSLIPRGLATVAVLEGKIVGVLVTSQEDEIIWINQLYVLPSNIHHGIGTALIALLLKNTTLTVRLYCYQENVHARRFYEKHGFVILEFSDGSDNEAKCPDVLYELRSHTSCTESI
jgi:GNAT superfamily N-acetyltransferase